MSGGVWEGRERVASELGREIERNGGGEEGREEGRARWWWGEEGEGKAFVFFSLVPFLAEAAFSWELLALGPFVARAVCAVVIASCGVAPSVSQLCVLRCLLGAFNPFTLRSRRPSVAAMVRGYGGTVEGEVPMGDWTPWG